MNKSPIKPVSFRAQAGGVPPYRLFRSAPNGVALILQTHDPETGTATPAADLVAYRTKRATRSAWGLIRTGSTMLLSKSAARFLIEAGTVQPIPEENFPRRSKPSPGRAEQ